MAKKKLADYVIDFYSNIGVDKIFVVYGAANGDLIDAFSRNKKTEYVAVLHEQAGGFAAEGYAKVKGVLSAKVTFCDRLILAVEETLVAALNV